VAKFSFASPRKTRGFRKKMTVLNHKIPRSVSVMLTIALYLLMFYVLYNGTVINSEHEEVESNASLICYSCIGV